MRRWPGSGRRRQPLSRMSVAFPRRLVSNGRRTGTALSRAELIFTLLGALSLPGVLGRTPRVRPSAVGRLSDGCSPDAGPSLPWFVCPPPRWRRCRATGGAPLSSVLFSFDLVPTRLSLATS